METSELKGIVNMCLKLQGTTLTFRVQKPPVDDAKRQKVGRSLVVLTVSSVGSCTQDYTYYSYTEECGDSCVAGKCEGLPAVPDVSELETTYEEAFGAQHLSDFLRSIDRGNVTLRLKASKPLIIHYKFGDEASYVCLVVAPKIES